MDSQRTRKALFLSTHSCGVRLCTVSITIIICVFLSTHSCGVRLGELRQPMSEKVFLSTHSCGVRRRRFGVRRCRYGNFYPRTPVECDKMTKILVDKLPISIHALLWSATNNSRIKRASLQLFLSTHSCGVRRADNLTYSGALYDFYPRTPVECDLLYASGSGARYYFYPRTPVECDNRQNTAG